MKNPLIVCSVFMLGTLLSTSVFAEDLPANATTSSNVSSEANINIPMVSWDKGVSALNLASRSGMAVKEMLIDEKTITLEGVDEHNKPLSKKYAIDEVKLVSEKNLLKTGAANPLAAKQISAILQVQVKAGNPSVLKKVVFESSEMAVVSWTDADGEIETAKLSLPRTTPVDGNGQVLPTGVTVL